MTRKGLILAMIGVAATGGAAAGQVSPTPTAAYSITATWSGDSEPGRLWVEQGPQSIELARAGTAWAGTTPIGQVRTARRANLIAQFGADQVNLPIRFTPQNPVMRLSVLNPPLVPCVEARVRALEAPGGTYAAKLEAYYKAKRLAQSDQCGATMQKRVVKAWFDRSYNLADENDHIALDQDAAAALKGIPLHRAYAEQMERRMTARLTQIDYSYQMALASGGEYALAVEVNEQLTERLRSDEGIASAVARYQDLTIEQLALDNELLSARAAASPQ